MASMIFTGGRFLDPRQDALRDGMEVLVEDGTVREVSDRPITSASATRIPLGGRTLMPGLIDAHIHIVLTEVNLSLLADMPLTLLAAKGSVAMRAMLLRGFTTLRDTGGADFGMKEAVEKGLFPRPAPVHRRPGHQPDRRARRLPQAHADDDLLLLLQRVVLYGARRGWRGRDGEGGARRAAQGRGPHQDHGVGRRRLAGSTRSRACNTAWTRSRRRWRRRRAGAAMSARMPIARRRSSARCAAACARSSTAT